MYRKRKGKDIYRAQRRVKRGGTLNKKDLDLYLSTVRRVNDLFFEECARRARAVNTTLRTYDGLYE